MFHIQNVSLCLFCIYEKKVNCSRYRPSVAHRVGRGRAPLFHDRRTRRGEWSAACPGRTLPPRKTQYPFYRRLGFLCVCVCVCVRACIHLYISLHRTVFTHMNINANCCECHLKSKQYNTTIMFK